MIALREHHLDDCSARVLQLIGLCLHDHAVTHRLCAGRARYAVDFADADPTGAEGRFNIFEVAKAWNENAVLARYLHKVTACLRFDFLTIDGNRNPVASLLAAIADIRRLSFY
jgi:hypothetical protein